MTMKEDIAVMKVKIKYIERATYACLVMIGTHVGVEIVPFIAMLILA